MGWVLLSWRCEKMGAAVIHKFIFTNMKYFCQHDCFPWLDNLMYYSVYY